jgi:thiamine biosynthesis lipoprotein ApbE
MKEKTYEVEFKSTTYRHYYVDAKNKAEAEEKAIEELECDTEVSSAWVENSKVERIANTEKENTWMNANGKLED